MKAYIQLARPFTLVSPALGFFSGGVMAWAAQGRGAFPVGVLAAGAAASALLNVFSNSLNQVYDLEIDRINCPQRPLPAGQLTVRQAGRFSVLCLLVSLAGAAAIRPELALIFALAAAATWAYSAPPLRTKARGALSNLTIAFARGLLLFVSGWTAAGSPWRPEPWAAGVVLGVYVFGAASTKDFSDVAGDEEFGIVTLPVKHGGPKAAKIIAPFLVAPFLLVPVFVYAGLLAKAALPVAGLAVYGIVTAVLLISEHRTGRVSRSRASWVHMYVLLILAQAGFAVCYALLLK